MNRLLIVLGLLCVLIHIPLEAKAINHENNKPISIHNETGEKVVGSVPEANVTLYAVEREGNLEKFRLEYKGGIQYFPYWMNVSNKTYWPQLLYSDINNDGKKELIIVLTTGYGTGVVQRNVHVMHKMTTNMGEVYREIIVDNPMAIILKNVKTKLTKSEAIITIGNKKTVINLGKLGFSPEYLFPDVAIGGLINFAVLDNELTAIMGAQTSPAGGYIGSFYITYTFKDEMYQMKKIKFIPLEKNS